MKFKNIFFLPFIILKAIYYWLLTPKNNLPGIEFAKFGRDTGFKIFLKNKEFISLTLSPVSIVRYFEFEYVKKNLGSGINNTSVLDVSSPYLFAFYICKNNSLTYNYINPDERDTNKIRTISKNFTFK